MMRRGSLLCLGLMSVVSLSACTAEFEREGPTFDEFMADSIRLADGRIIADQDILFADEEAARDYFEEEMADSASRLGLDDDDLDQPRSTVNLVDGVEDTWPGAAGQHLTYCVDTGSFGSRGSTLRAALDRAMDSWSDRVGVQFEEVDVDDCDHRTQEVVFDVRWSDSSLFFASGFFPSSSRSERELLVTTEAFTTNLGGRDLEGILRHELGHVLGLRHEHVWLTPLCTSETSEDALALTDYDVNSVMHYPQCRSTRSGGYRQTDLDYLGAFKLYGLSTALTTTML